MVVSAWWTGGAGHPSVEGAALCRGWGRNRMVPGGGGGRAGQTQEQTPVDDTHADVEIKPQLKPRGSVAKEEDPKPSHQLYKLQIKFT